MLTSLKKFVCSDSFLFPPTVVLTANVTVESLSSMNQERDTAVHNKSEIVHEKPQIKAIDDIGNSSREFTKKANRLTAQLEFNLTFKIQDFCNLFMCQLERQSCNPRILAFKFTETMPLTTSPRHQKIKILQKTIRT